MQGYITERKAYRIRKFLIVMKNNVDRLIFDVYKRYVRMLNISPLMSEKYIKYMMLNTLMDNVALFTDDKKDYAKFRCFFISLLNNDSEIRNSYNQLLLLVEAITDQSIDIHSVGLLINDVVDTLYDICRKIYVYYANR